MPKADTTMISVVLTFSVVSSIVNCGRLWGCWAAFAVRADTGLFHKSTQNIFRPTKIVGLNLSWPRACRQLLGGRALPPYGVHSHLRFCSLFTRMLAPLARSPCLLFLLLSELLYEAHLLLVPLVRELFHYGCRPVVVTQYGRRLHVADAALRHPFYQALYQQ